ncbi:bifunctional transcriptional activator/DNA repair enzyme AdaA [Microvirga lenta]|uniref:bifunctional transcriptional activator/DNA repair enzyme AdaA n=1 Tax=Microvirga lenta TaxID=2881337 RepID=UPI001CFFD1E5|nr:trifunctional transcriptional activator/DNA repair protein Ada/methylated-DNA--[protein]-cysteine S-methyltransferase [Microvirga lenta]MCB5176152.1 trifunctional transcriptional activator/DNA repair protein Ada/methylated-DNA--[protein]-cysteine S-methyltransferase [Microvirga lenta]
MTTSSLPPTSEMVRAMLTCDAAYEGVFYTAVKTTGIFCRPTCTARKPKPENVVFHRTAEDALTAGFRPCKRCRPLDVKGAAPDWVAALLKEVEAEPSRRWTDEDLVARAIDPVRLRRWFKEQFGMTFHAYVRARRLGAALGSIGAGESIDGAAYDHGYESVSGFRDAFRQTIGTTPGRSRSKALMLYARILTPLGPMIAMAEERGLSMLEFTDRPALPAEIEELRGRYGYAITPGRNGHLDRIERELEQYFAGTLTVFEVALWLPGTAFQQEVWTALQAVPFGETRSYGELAASLGRPGASRAVGRANGQNRVSIVVPCHRIVGADGSLTGYGGGQPRKDFLLKLERRIRFGQGDAVAARSIEVQASLF